MEKYTEIKKYLESNLSVSRYHHSLKVEELSKNMADRFGLNQYNSSIAALSHDICREMNNEELLDLALKNNIILTRQKIEDPILLHGIAGAIVLKETFHITDSSILNALKFHISGSDTIDDLGKVVFAADYLESGRSFLSNNEWKMIFDLNLDEMVLVIALRMQSYLESQGKITEPELKDMILKLKKEINK